MKAPYSLFNTHIKTVKGMFGVKDSFTRTKVDIRCTSETNRETLSLTCGDVQILVKVKHIEELIDETRKDRKDLA